jgi:uncharacterized membrane protein YhdT
MSKITNFFFEGEGANTYFKRALRIVFWVPYVLISIIMLFVIFIVAILMTPILYIVTGENLIKVVYEDIRS